MLSYLEYPILIVQEYILVALVFKYKRMFNQNNMCAIAAYFAIVLLFAYQICPRFLLSMAVVSWIFVFDLSCIIIIGISLSLSQPFCTPIGATSKVLQLMEILRTKDSTTVSLTTWFLSAFTNLSKFMHSAWRMVQMRLAIWMTGSFPILIIFNIFSRFFPFFLLFPTTTTMTQHAFIQRPLKPVIKCFCSTLASHLLSRCLFIWQPTTTNGIVRKSLPHEKFMWSTKIKDVTKKVSKRLNDGGNTLYTKC